MKKSLTLFCCLSLVALSSCGNELNGKWHSIIAKQNNNITTINTTVPSFNTVMELRYFINDENVDKTEEVINNVSELFNNEVSRLHKQFDRHYYYYEDDSTSDIITNIKTINDSYGTNQPVKCSDELYNLLKLSIKGYELTNGYFNVFTGSLTDYWNYIFHEVIDSYTPVTDIDPYYNFDKKEELQTIVDSIPSTIEEVKQQLTFDDENKTVTFNKLDKNIVAPYISVGGIAKGLATDYIKSKILLSNHYDGYLVSGGSSISTLSKPIFTKKEKGQKLSVINPLTSTIVKKEVAFQMKFTDEFNFSTSGNYTTGKSYSFITDNDSVIFRHHIINPFTGYPESYYSSVSIATNNISNAMVDVLSTALMNVTIEEGIMIRSKFLNEFADSNIEVFYLKQNGFADDASMSLYATSNLNDTLEVNKEIKVTYEN